MLSLWKNPRRNKKKAETAPLQRITFFTIISKIIPYTRLSSFLNLADLFLSSYCARSCKHAICFRFVRWMCVSESINRNGKKSLDCLQNKIEQEMWIKFVSARFNDFCFWWILWIVYLCDCSYQNTVTSKQQTLHLLDIYQSSCCLIWL